MSEREVDEVYKPEVLTQDTMGEEGVWGKVSDGEVGVGVRTHLVPKQVFVATSS